MSIFIKDIAKVDKNLVHKDSDEDVLIFNGRGALPSFIEKKLLSSWALSQSEMDFFYENYVACDCLTQNSVTGEVFYRLRSILPMLKKATVLAFANADILPSCVLNNYEERGDFFILKTQYVNENEELQLLKLFGNRKMQIDNLYRRQLSVLLGSLSGLERPDIYYTTMFNDAKNYYFYRKHHEHVPGVMFIEVARQAMYEHFYTYHGIEKGSVSLSIQSLLVDFKNYANTNYPIHLMVESVPVDNAKDGYASIQTMEKKVTFYQSTNVIAVASLRYLSIQMGLFKKIREVEPDPAHRYFPIKNFSNNVFLTDEDGKKYEGQLNSLSLNGMNLTCPTGCEPELGAKFDYSFYIEALGFIHGTAQLRWKTLTAKGLDAGFLITQMSESVEKKLKDAIKNYTHVNASREIV